MPRIPAVTTQAHVSSKTTLALFGAACLPAGPIQVGSPAELTTGANLVISQDAVSLPSDSQIAAVTEDPDPIELIINDYRTYYKNFENDQFSSVDFDEFAQYLRELAESVLHVLSNPEELAPIVTDVLVVGGALKIGELIAIAIVKRSKEAVRGHPNRYTEDVMQGFEELQEFFREHSEGRLTDIASKTGMDKEKTRRLLRLGEVYGAYQRRPNGIWKRL